MNIKFCVDNDFGVLPFSEIKNSLKYAISDVMTYPPTTPEARSQGLIAVGVPKTSSSNGDEVEWEEGGLICNCRVFACKAWVVLRKLGKCISKLSLWHSQRYFNGYHEH